MNRLRSLLLLASSAMLLVLSPATLRAETDVDWPQFHGPNRSNKSPDTGLLKQWPDDGPPLLWKVSGCGQGYSGVAIADGMIFTAGDFDDSEMLLALDMNGQLQWKAPNGDAWQGSSPGSRTTPTYQQGRLYQMNPLGRLACFDARTGAEIWAVDLRERFGARFGIWASAENLVLEDDKVLCMPGGLRGRVVALDKRTGETVWANVDIEHSAAYCSPLVVTHNGRRQLLSLTQRSLVGVDVESGRLIWSAPFVPRSPQNALTPVYSDGYVYVACGHFSGGSLLKINAEAGTAETIWHRRDLDSCHDGAMLLDGRLYGSACRNGGKHFYCVDYLTGRTIALDQTMGKVGITYADGMLYCLNHQGTMYLVKVTSNGFEIVSQFNLRRRPANSYLAHPVVCGGRLYIRCNDDLFVYDVRKPT